MELGSRERAPEAKGERARPTTGLSRIGSVSDHLGRVFHMSICCCVVGCKKRREESAREGGDASVRWCVG